MTYYTHYDVFLNHRGPELKENFAKDLHSRLVSYGLNVFLDKPEMQAGLRITDQIEHAIKTASIHIAMFSPCYADSRWCLDELRQMVESCKSGGATFIPVFYWVKPSVVSCKANGEYTKALHGREEKEPSNSDTIQSWKNALSYAAGISGFELEEGDREYNKLLDEIVERVLEIGKKTSLKYVTGPEFLEEMSEFVEEMSLHQSSLEAKVVGIVGPGGVGKTKLAEDFFNSKRSKYSGSCFLYDVKESSQDSLLMRLIRDLTQFNVSTDTLNIGMEMLKKRISAGNVVIVLDDVDQEDQMNVVLQFKDTLHSNSLLLVTCREKKVLKRAGILETSIYALTGLFTSCRKTKFMFEFERFAELPTALDQLSRLKELWLRDSPNLKCLSGSYQLLSRLRELNIVDCGIKFLSEDLVKMNNLKILRVYNCPLGELSFKKHPDRVILSREAKQISAETKLEAPLRVCPILQHLRINSCTGLRDVVSLLPSTLITLDLSYCERLRQLRGLYLARLEQLDISCCVEIEEIPSLHMLKSLKELKASRCFKLKSIEGLADLSENLQRLYLRECCEIQKLQGVEGLMSLEKLDASECPKLKWGEGVLEQLRQRLNAGLIV